MRPRPAVCKIWKNSVFLCRCHRTGTSLCDGLSALPVSAGRGRVCCSPDALRMFASEYSLCAGDIIARSRDRGGDAGNGVGRRHGVSFPGDCKINRLADSQLLFAGIRTMISPLRGGDLGEGQICKRRRRRRITGVTSLLTGSRLLFARFRTTKKPEVLANPRFSFTGCSDYSALPSEPRTSLILWM